MGLGTLTIGSATYVDAGNGRYIASTSVFGGPKEEIRITPGRTSVDSSGVKKTTATITYVWEKDVASIRRVISTSIQMQLQEGMVSTDADISISNLSTLVTSGLLDKILSGAS